MNLQIELAYLHKEHRDILNLIISWERSLNRLISERDEERRRGLAELREMGSKILAIQKHCRAEEEAVESPNRLYLGSTQFERLHDEHADLARLIQGVVSELRFANVDRTEEILTCGRQLAEFLRQHIAYEEGLLTEIQEGHNAEEKLLLKYSESAE